MSLTPYPLDNEARGSLGTWVIHSPLDILGDLQPQSVIRPSTSSFNARRKSVKRRIYRCSQRGALDN